MAKLLADLRYALRGMRRAPLFTSIAILSLALGIGANTAIFTLMDQLMLRKLPIRAPEQLVMLVQHGSHNGSNMGPRMHSYPVYQDFQQKAEPFSEVICRRLTESSVAIDGHTERVQAEMVSGNYFSMLGVKAAAGRLFRTEEDDRVFRGHPVVVLSYDYWVTRFARDPNAIGKKILVSNYPMTIVGVSAPGFSGLDPAVSPQIRVPVLMEPIMNPQWAWMNPASRRARWVQVFARLKPGYTAATAQPALQTLFHQVREFEVTQPEAKDWSAYSREQFLKGTVTVEPAATGYSELRNNFSKALVVLMSMVGLVLLIACANVANLLIAKAFARQKEIAVRLSIGATRWQLVRQLLMESLLLSAAGGVAGIALAVALTRGLLALIPAEENPLLIQPSPDLRVLLFTVTLALATGLLFGLVPALRASRPDLWSTLKDAVVPKGGMAGSLLLRKSLVAAQVALSFLLLFGAGLFVRSLQNLRSTNTGLRDIDNLITFRVDPALNGYNDERTVHFYDDLLDRVRAVPGVKTAAVSAMSLLAGDEWDNSTQVEGYHAKDGEDTQAFMNALSPGYFETMGIPLLEGRDFDRRDMRKDAKVAIVNEHFARHFFGDRSPIGRHIGQGRKDKLEIEIVGVVADSLYDGPREGVRRQVFIPNWGNNGVAFYVRGNLQSSALYAGIRGEVRRLDPSMPLFGLKTLGRQLDETLLTERLIALLSAGFGLLATLLATIGLYGVMAFVVARRTKELGLRMALGAARTGVIWLVMREVLALLAIGLAIGIPTAAALGSLVSAQLYGIQARDPWIAGGSVVVLAAVGAFAGMIPATRASRIDPILALRYE